MIDNPCFDRKTHTDCPKRAVGCDVDCPEWATYVAKREKIYHERKAQNDANSAISDHKFMRRARWQRKYLRNGTKKFRRS